MSPNSAKLCGMNVGEGCRMLSSKCTGMLHNTHILSFVAHVRVSGNILLQLFNYKDNLMEAIH